MKKLIDTTREGQRIVHPGKERASVTSRGASIVNNRPEAIYQRKLKETMNAHAARKALPIQQKTAGGSPKGSTRFQRLATAMGEKYGVDTSGLVATHHSLLPAKLNAEATIQGNHIHFAPGRDTDYNIRHEVAHAIDNTLHGTPKGKHVVNGQKIDTTRENVADRMAKGLLPVQRKEKQDVRTKQQHSLPGQTIQRKIYTDRLNVAGEIHYDSKEKVKIERDIINNYFSSKNAYWTEHEIYSLKDPGVKDRLSNRVYGDDNGYAYLQAFSVYRFYLFKTIEALEGGKWEDAKRYFKRLHVYKGEMFASAIRGNAYDYIPNSKVFRNANHDALIGYGDYTCNKQNLIGALDNLMNDELSDSEKAEQQKKVQKELEMMKKQFEKLDKGVVSLVARGQLQDINVTENLVDDPFFQHIKLQRSIKMHEFATLNAQRLGVWKIGDAHVRDIKNQGLYDKTSSYNLLTKEEFKSSMKKIIYEPGDDYGYGYGGISKSVSSFKFKWF